MKVTFPPEILKETNEDYIFLKSLDHKLHTIKETTYCGRNVFYDIYDKNESISSEEIDRVLELIRDHTHLALTPMNTAMGFQVGFEILYTGRNRKQSLLRFLETQLPEGYDFSTLLGHFMERGNRHRLTSAGFSEPVDNRNFYDY